MGFETEPFDDEIEDRIASLEYQLGVTDEEPSSFYEPSEAQLAATALRISDLENGYGVELDDEDFDRVGQMAQELGGDVESAFRIGAGVTRGH